MAEFQLVMPKMGESIIEATILTWHKKEGEHVDENEIILEVATDKVDSEIPSPVSGIVKKLLFKPDETVAIDQTIAIIETEGDTTVSERKQENLQSVEKEIPLEPSPSEPIKKEQVEKQKPEKIQVPVELKLPNEGSEILQAATEVPYQPKSEPHNNSTERYYSPLVLNIAKVEGISSAELERITGTGENGRLTKYDVLKYLENKKNPEKPKAVSSPNTPAPIPKSSSSPNTQKDEIIEMDRMRKLIAKNMVESKHIAAHVSSFVECDMTSIVKWREKNKLTFEKREGFKLTYMPIITEAIIKAIKDFPMINISVDGDKIIKKKNINIGIATALPSGNLIVPVIKNADQMNLLGLATSIQQLAQKARNNQLSAQDIDGGTYTISNIGTFGNILGTPIIPQPQVAIMAVGSITKKPVVLETPEGDVIAIRQMMYLSHTYDHRVVDGALGGMFVKKVADYLENFDQEQEI